MSETSGTGGSGTSGGQTLDSTASATASSAARGGGTTAAQRGHEQAVAQTVRTETQPEFNAQTSPARQPATPPRRPARVAISHTNERQRTQERVLDLVREALSHLGGMGAFVKQGQSVLIKPNQTVFYSAEEGCTTDPLVVGACIRLAKEAGASKVQIGESSGGFFDSLQCMSITGMAEVAKREGAELVDLGRDSVPNRMVPIPGGRVIQEVPLPAPLLDADVIIDCPKAKNHHIEPISGALKNWVGAVNKQWRQYNHGDHEMIGRFMDIMMVSRPHLCVVDALICGEGDGPIADLPRWCGCILASDDPVATDVAIARLMGHDWRKLRFAEEAESRGLGVRDPIEFLGVPLEQVAFEAWPGHQGFDYLPVNLLVGEGVTLAGTVGHVKSVLDSMLRRGELWEVVWLKGTPTIMIGEIEDPDFEEHVKAGPYVVFDDAALPKYKHDPRVHFVPGHPVLRTAMPELFKGLGVNLPGKAMMKWQQFQRWGMHQLEYGTPSIIAGSVAKPAAQVGIAALVVAAAVTGVRRWMHRGTDGLDLAGQLDDLDDLGHLIDADQAGKAGQAGQALLGAVGKHAVKALGEGVKHVDLDDFTGAA